MPIMEDGSISERLKKRFQLFGQFFKGFSNSGESDNNAHPHMRPDHRVYDDTENFGKKRVLEFSNPKKLNGEPPMRIEPSEERSPFSTRTDPFDFFGSTKSLFEEFEHTMKIFDDFAFILRHPNLGFGTSGFPDMDLPPNHDTTIEEIGNDQDDGRYSKFFGGGIPNSTTPRSNNPESAPPSDQNMRDIMLKPDQEAKIHRRPNQEYGSGHSFLGRILDSIWDAESHRDSDVDVVLGSQFFPNTEFQGSSYFTFSSQESSLTSDGSNVSITATKIRETPEGREIITYKTKGDGATEETREFIKREDIPNSPTRSPIIGGFFRPRL